MDLVDIRCPFTYAFKNKYNGEHKHRVCAKVAVKVTAGSAGEAYCNFCKKKFDFEVSPYSATVVNRVIAKQDVN